MTLSKRQEQAQLEKLLSLSKRERDLIKQELIQDVHEVSKSFVADAANYDDATAEVWLHTLMTQLSRLAFVNSNFKMTDNERLDEACRNVVTVLLREMLKCDDEIIVDACCSKLHNIVQSQSIVKKAFQDAYEPFKGKEFLFNTLKKGDKVELIFRILHG